MTNKPIVTFIAICFRETHEINMFIGMLLCMKNPLWEAIIWHDEPNPWMREQVEKYNDPRITFIENKINTGSWGCYNRIAALKMAKGEYIIQTTIQEYFLPITVDVIEENKKEDFIYWACVHHSFNYELLNTEPMRGKIDWSNFAIKITIANKVGINYPDAYMGDGIFVEDCMKSGLIKRKLKIYKVLNIKN